MLRLVAMGGSGEVQEWFDTDRVCLAHMSGGLVRVSVLPV